MSIIVRPWAAWAFGYVALLARNPFRQLRMPLRGSELETASGRPFATHFRSIRSSAAFVFGPDFGPPQQRVVLLFRAGILSECPTWIGSDNDSSGVVIPARSRDAHAREMGIQ